MKIKKFNESIESQYDKEIFLVVGDDWKGIYHNGKLISEGHSLDLYYVLEKLGYSIGAVFIDDEETWDSFGNSCPEDLEEVKLRMNAKKYNV